MAGGGRRPVERGRDGEDGAGPEQDLGLVREPRHDVNGPGGLALEEEERPGAARGELLRHRALDGGAAERRPTDGLPRGVAALVEGAGDASVQTPCGAGGGGGQGGRGDGQGYFYGEGGGSSPLCDVQAFA